MKSQKEIKSQIKALENWINVNKRFAETQAGSIYGENLKNMIELTKAEIRQLKWVLE